jgi:hypothetical protein
MEPEGSFSCLQEPVTGPYPEHSVSFLCKFAPLLLDLPAFHFPLAAHIYVILSTLYSCILSSCCLQFNWHVRSLQFAYVFILHSVLGHSQ